MEKYKFLDKNGLVKLVQKMLDTFIKKTDFDNDLTIVKKDITNNTQNIISLQNMIKSLHPFADDANFITVGKTGCDYTKINDAIGKAKTLNPSLLNRITILIMPGIYQEKIVLNDYHGIDFIGLNKENVIIQETGVYPDCVVHVQGDYTFKNLTLKNLTNATYIVHDDPTNSNVQGKVVFENCIFDGGVNGVGHGSGNNTILEIIKCLFINQTGHHIYAHNSPYASSNQNLVLLRNVFNNSKVLQMDDAGYTYGQSKTSKMNCYFKDNICLSYGYGEVLFRLNTNDSGTNKTYIKSDNFNMGLGCNGNDNIPSLNSNISNQCAGIIQQNVYVYVPPANADNYSHVSIPLAVYGHSYNIKINSVTLPGVGYFNGDCSVDGKTNSGFNLLFNNNPSIIGKTVIVNFDVIIG